MTRFEQKSHPYLDAEQREVDFTNKRLAFWFENVPANIRRLEYELWRRYRELYHIRRHAFRETNSIGRFRYKPGYSKKLSDQDWHEFQESFLLGVERKQRFEETVRATREAIPAIKSKVPGSIQEGQIQLVALFGSSFYGPRKAGEHLSDVDVALLLDRDDASSNFEVFPKSSIVEAGGMPFHIIGTGRTDEARGSEPIHWLLYPHYPLWNGLEDSVLKDILCNILTATEQRTDEIKITINDLDKEIQEAAKEKIYDR